MDPECTAKVGKVSASGTGSKYLFFVSVIPSYSVAGVPFKGAFWIMPVTHFLQCWEIRVVGSQISRILRLERWPRGKNICCSSRGPMWVWFPAPEGHLSIICNTMFRWSDALFRPPQVPGIRGACTYMQAKHSCIKEWINLIFKNLQSINMIARVAISFPRLVSFSPRIVSLFREDSMALMRSCHGIAEVTDKGERI